MGSSVNTGIPISSDLRLSPVPGPEGGNGYVLHRGNLALFIDTPAPPSPSCASCVLTTRQANPALPEGMSEIPFPPEKGFYRLLFMEGLLFAGDAPAVLPALAEWEGLAAAFKPETILLSSSLPPMTLGVFLDRLRAAS